MEELVSLVPSVCVWEREKEKNEESKTEGVLYLSPSLSFPTINGGLEGAEPRRRDCNAIAAGL